MRHPAVRDMQPRSRPARGTRVYDEGTSGGPADPALPTRRSLREAHGSRAARRAAPVATTGRTDRGASIRPEPPVPPARTADRTAPAVPPIARRRRTAGRVVASVGALSFAGAIVATLALPSYAFQNDATGPAGSASVTRSASGHQGLTVSGDVSMADVKRDGFTATSAPELLRQQYATQFASYTGPSASDYIKNPAHPPFSLSAVIAVAEKYQGVPYVFGGADPSGFDCSGFVMFVYAQFGIALPHSVHQQDEIGAHIAPSDAQPGDIVVFNDDSHDGFYLGDGMILHAPYPGASVRIQPLWSSDVHFIRFGI